MTSCRRLRLAGLFTHFANSDSDVEFTDEQLIAFDKFIADHKSMIPPDCHIHVASSFATLRNKRYHKTMVRVGLAWAGYGVEWVNGPTLPAAQQLRPIVSWKSRLVNVKNIPAGTPVGYGSSWTAKRTSVVGLIPVGYADGYPIGLGTRNKKAKGASVGILASGEAAPPIGYANVIGAVNMDQITVDLTDIVLQARKVGRSVGVGTMVELISPDAQAPNQLSTLAAMAGTIPHEMLCRLNSRLKRVYTTTAAATLEPVMAGRAMAG
jgi:alanine racemase